MDIKDLINKIGSGDAQASNNTFNDIIHQKMNAALDVEKQTIAQSMYGSETPVEEPTQDVNI
jgi:hypothetical protein